MKKFTPLPYAFKFILVPIILFFVFLFFKLYWLGFIALILTAYILYFFRDPVRPLPKDQNAVLCPADGKILSIDKIRNAEFDNGECYRIKIFLSIFNVHIQRAPIAGKISSIIYNPGKFLNALDEKSSDENENNIVCIDGNNKVRVVVKQIAGIIARRIICKCSIGDSVNKGEKYGLICFGSRVEALIPTYVEIKVKPGMKVYAGETVIGILH